MAKQPEPKLMLTTAQGVAISVDSPAFRSDYARQIHIKAGAQDIYFSLDAEEVEHLIHMLGR